MFWKISTDPEVTNTEVLEKAVTRLITLLKYTGESTEEKRVIDEAIDNVKEGRAVLQSLKVIRKIITNKEKLQAEMIQFAVEKDILKYVFENLGKLKKGLKEKFERMGIDQKSITEALINQHLPTKGFTFEQNILNRLSFIDFGRILLIQSYTDCPKTTIGLSR